MAFIVPVVKKDYSLYTGKVSPTRSSPRRSLFKVSVSTEKLTIRKMFGVLHSVSELRISSSLQDTRHVHFAETFSYFVYDDDTLSDDEENIQNCKELEMTRDDSDCKSTTTVPVVLRPALRRSSSTPLMPPTRVQRQSSIRTVWKLAAMCSPKN